MLPLLRRWLGCCRRWRRGYTVQEALVVLRWRRLLRSLLHIFRIRRVWGILGHHLQSFSNLKVRYAALKLKIKDK